MCIQSTTKNMTSTLIVTPFFQSTGVACTLRCFGLVFLNAFLIVCFFKHYTLIQIQLMQQTFDEWHAMHRINNNNNDNSNMFHVYFYTQQQRQWRRYHTKIDSSVQRNRSLLVRFVEQCTQFKYLDPHSRTHTKQRMRHVPRSSTHTCLLAPYTHIEAIETKTFYFCPRNYCLIRLQCSSLCMCAVFSWNIFL